MAKQLNVNLAFSADTGKVKQQIAEINKLLSNLGSYTSQNNTLGLNKELTESVSKAAELKAILNSSLNPSGGLDLGKFNSELKKGKTNLQDYAQHLISLGPQGEQAFVQLARAINSAEVPLKRSNAMLKEFATTLKNTARWQISSSILHGFMGTLQSAYGYAEDLNESLNNIRIVTGQSTAEMAKFAKEANRAAKQLNTTTTSYTDAALIYYQQGLTDEQVKERTDVTIKMANVARESATEVSSYMTAIWNNFDQEGTQSLEHFGDVITALGAATAASTEEIAHGLEKFAAVADTIGLSYEYATSAIATIVDKTRQSEDVVGTALKTIFARIQGLSLGETLEDGTDLNKYSKALMSVGISIKDQNGELKDMDTILDEMGAKWGTISKDQQVALAQTVAGVRQYNQLVSLMDNYDAFKDNIDIANNSDGALQKQADIYAESWEAARDRVQAAAEGLYDSLLNDDFFIALLNGFEKLLTTLENVIDGLGGMGGAILLAGSLLFKYFGPEVAESINNGIYNMTLRTKGGLEEILKLRKQANQQLGETFADTAEDKSHIYSPANVKGEVYSSEANLQDAILLKNEELLSQGREMNEIEQKKLQIMLDESKALGEQLIKKSEAAQKSNSDLQSNNKNVVRKYSAQYGKIEGKENLSQDLKHATELEKRYAALEKVYAKVNKAQKDFGEDTKDIKEYIENMCKQLDMADDEIEEFMNSFKGCKDVEEIINQLETEVQELGAKAQKAFDDLDADTGNIKGFSKALEQAQEEARQTGVLIGETGQLMHDHSQLVEQTGEVIENATPKAYDFGECVGALGNGIVTLSSAVTSLIGLGSIWNDEDLSLGEKVLTTVTTLGMVVPMLTDAFSKNNLEKMKSIGLTTKDLLLDQAKRLNILAETAGREALNAKIVKEIILKTIKQALDLKQLALTLAIIAVLGTLIAVTTAVINAINAQAEAEERANEVAEKSEQKYQDLKIAYDELKSSIEDYESSLKAFQELSKGADGYAESLENLNEQARQLIEEHGLYNDWSYGSNGEIVIDEDALKEALGQAEQAQGRAGSTAAAAAVTSTQTQKEGIYSKYDKSIRTTGFGETATTEVYVDPAKVQALNDLGHLQEEQFQTLLNYTQSFGDEAQLSIEELSEATNLSAEQINGLTAMISTMGDSAEENYNSLRSLNTKLDYQIENQALRGMQETGMFDGDENAQNAYANLLAQDSDYQKAVTDNASQASNISEYGKDGLKELLKEANFEGMDNGMLSDKELAMAYAKYVEGWSDEDLSKATYDGGWGKGTVTAGENTTGQLDDQYMRDAIANALLSQKLAENIASDDSEYGQAIRDDINLLRQELDANTSNVALNALSNYQEGGEIKLDSSLLSPEDIEELKAAASEMGSSYKDAMMEAIDDYDVSKYHDRLESQQSANIDKQVAVEELDAEAIEMQSELIMDNTEALKDNQNAAKQLAVNNARMNKGMETLIDNWEDWSDVLKNGDKNTSEYAETLADLQPVIGDLVGLTDNLEKSLSADFLGSAETMELLERAANADAEAVEELGYAVAKDLTSNLQIADSYIEAFNNEDIDLAIELDDGTVIEDLAAFETRFNETKNSVLGYIDDISNASLGVGDSISNAIGDDEVQNFVNGLNEMAMMTHMSVEDMQGMLNSMGVEATVESKWVDEKVKVPTYRTEKKRVSWNPFTGESVYDETTYQTGEVEVDGGRYVASISYDGSNPNTQISYVGHGNSSTGNKKSAAAAAEKRNGGSKKEKEPPKDKKITQKDEKEFKKVDEETERYHEINEKLESMERRLERVSKAKDRAFGKDKIKKMEQESALLKEQLELEKEKQRQIEENLKKDKDVISKYGASYDNEGNLTNYDEMVNSQVNAYNSAYEAYIAAVQIAEQNWNGSAKDEAADTVYEDATEAAEKSWEEAQDKYGEFQDDIAQYEETLDLFEESKDTLTEIQNQLYDLALEKVEYIVDLKINVAEDSLEYLEYLLENLDDSAYDAAESIALLGKQAEESMKKIDAYQDGLKGIFKNHGLSDEDFDKFVAGDEATMNKLAGMSFTEDEVNTIRNYKSALLEENRTLLELQDTVRGKVMEAFDELSGELDEQIDKLDHLSSITQSYQNIIDLVGQEYLGISDELMKTMDKTAMNVATDTLSATKDKLDALKESRTSAQEALEEARSKGMDDTAKHWEDVIEEMDKDIMSAEEEFMGSWENALQVAADNFEKEITRAVDRFSEACGGAAGSLDKLQEAYDRQQEIDSRYLDDYKQIYELSKLTRSINASIDDTSNLNAKREYKELLEEIQAIEENGTKLSEYDLANLQRKFELKQAELALEEAKDAKSQVRMTQDLEGNWGYVYTADEDAVANAEQNYEDKLYAMQAANDEYITELQQLIITAEQDCMEEIANLNINDFASKEEYYAACQEIANKYYDKIGYYMGEMGKALDNNKILYENDWTKYSEMTGYKISDNQNYVDSFNETALSTLTGFDTMEGFQQNFNDAIGAPGQPGTLLGDLDLAYAEWEKNVEEVMGEAGTSVEDFAGLMEDEAERINDQSDSIAEETEDMADDMADTMDDIIDDVQEWEETYGQEIQAMIDANNRLIESFNELLAKWSEVSNSGATDPQIDIGDSGGGGDDGGGGGGGDSGGGGNSGPSATEIATEAAEIIQGVHKGTIPQTASGWVPSAQSMGYSSSAISIARQAFNDSKDGDGYSYCYQKALQLVGSYDTGGYTGEWGPQGRLAFLHQKEIVLNARDTENLLAAVDMIRQISQTIDLNALSASQGLNSLLYAGTVKDHKETIEQEVTIHAEFPNATNHSEIEEAFNNIVNMASQYANRKL